MAQIAPLICAARACQVQQGWRAWHGFFVAAEVRSTERNPSWTLTLTQCSCSGASSSFQACQALIM